MKLMYEKRNFDGKKNAISNNKRREFLMSICWKVYAEITVITTYARNISTKKKQLNKVETNLHRTLLAFI